MIENRHIKRNIARERAHAVVASRAVSPRWMLALLGLIALAVQSFIVQAHIHSPQTRAAVSLAAPSKNAIAQSILLVNRPATVPLEKFPAGGDPANCPICQVAAHSGQFLHSAAALAAIPASVSVHFVNFNEALPSFLAVSHSWQGRAPPQA